MPMRLRMMTMRPDLRPWTVIGVCTAALTLSATSKALDGPIPGRSSTESVGFVSAAAARMHEDVGYLASDLRDGRGPGTRGIEEAADYIGLNFKAAGLRPAPGADGYFQPFTIGGSRSAGHAQELVFRGPSEKSITGRNSTDFSPLGIGIGSRIDRLPIVFAGYGITARDASEKLDYDDYAGLDVQGKAVLILRREPQDEDEASPFTGKQMSRFATFQHKATNAFQHGAAAVLMVNDRLAVQGGNDRLMKFDDAGTHVYAKIPFVMLSRDLADRLLAAAGQPALADLEKQIDSDGKPRSRALKEWTLSGRIEIETEELRTKNVVGVLEGSGLHADETVVIGGHYDHLGHGGLLSGSMAPLSQDIHNGADDNASGTSMVLELARRLGARRDPPPRRIVFIAFSGEERGLLGSQYYTKHPLFPLSTTVTMFNCDMVGRLSEKDELTMIGTGTSPGFEELVDVLGRSSGLKIKKVKGMTDGFGGSDHQSFARYDIPVLFAFTGVHRDYHRPSDDSNLINYSGMSRIADYLELLVLDIVRRPERPTYTRVAEHAPSNHAKDPARSGMSTYLGTMPDYEASDQPGMKIQGVSEGSPAEKGGLKGGDVIIGLAGKKVGTIYDYMEILGVHKPGDEVEVIVKRGGAEVKLRVKLGSRPGR